MNPAEIVRAALAELREGSVILRAGHSRNLRWANSALTTNGDMRGTHLTVAATSARAGGSGVSVLSGQVSGPEAAAGLAARAAEAAAGAPPVDAADLPEGPAADLDQPAADLDEDTTERMLSAVGTFLAQPAAQFGYAEADRTTTYLATTAGTRVRHVQDAIRLEASARDATGSTWWGTNTWDADVAAAAAAQGGNLRLQAAREDLAPGRHRVLLTPSAVADLLIYLAWSAGGRDAVEGHNVFSRPGGGTRVGERLTPRRLSLYADPRHPELRTSDVAMVEVNSSMESVFDNGLPLSRQELLRDGQLVALRCSRPTAARFGLPPVLLADNLVLDDPDGHGDLDALVARTADAVLVTCLWYIREVDPQTLLLTGLTRDGVYRVRDGRIVAALPNFRFNVAVPDLLGRIVDASATHPCLPREWADWFTRTAMPALVVDGFNLSSVSDAR
jgi:predicted Zn-dependent protease